MENACDTGRKLFTLALAAFSALTILSSYSFAQENVINSTNHKIILVTNEAGGNVSGQTLKTDVSMYFLQGFSSSSSQRVCLGVLCVDFGPGPPDVLVTFIIEANISGVANDTLAIGDNTTAGLYKNTDTTKYYGCVQDTGLTDSPVFGLVYSGTGGFHYVRADAGSSFRLTMTQEAPGNRFVIPVTQDGCGVVSNRLPLTFPNIFTLPFVPFGDLLNAVEIILDYSVDLVGDFERTGTFTLVLNRNETQIIGNDI